MISARYLSAGASRPPAQHPSTGAHAGHGPSTAVHAGHPSTGAHAPAASTAPCRPMQGISAHHMRYRPAQHTLEELLQDSTQHQSPIQATCKQDYPGCMASMPPAGKQKRAGSSGGWLLSCFGCLKPDVSAEHLRESLRSSHDSSSSDWPSVQQAVSCSWSSNGGSNNVHSLNSSVNSSSLSKAIKSAGAGSTQEGTVTVASGLRAASGDGSCAEELHQSAYCKPVTSKDGISFTRNPRVSQHSFWQCMRPQQGSSQLIISSSSRQQEGMPRRRSLRCAVSDFFTGNQPHFSMQHSVAEGPRMAGPMVPRCSKVLELLFKSVCQECFDRPAALQQ